jgi:hypothetical protein
MGIVSNTLSMKLFSRNVVLSCLFGRQAQNVGECAEWLMETEFYGLARCKADLTSKMEIEMPVLSSIEVEFDRFPTFSGSSGQV